MTDTNYNDGKWHGWNGGECPVHPKTEVETVSLNGDTRNTSRQQRLAGDLLWGNPIVDIVAFRVTKEHKEPREFWLIGGQWTQHKPFAEERIEAGEKVIHVREVIGGDT